jgi:TolB-like protein
MKKLIKCLFFLMCAFLATTNLWAKDRNRIAVFPFSVHSAENIDYIQRGVADMLSSRISVSEKIEVISPDAVSAVLNAGVPKLTPSDIYALGKKLSADYVVWGSITKIGNSLSIDGRLFEISPGKVTVTIAAQLQSMDEVIPKVGDFAQRIESHIAGSPAPSSVTLPSPKEKAAPSQPAGQSAREAEIISGMKSSKKGTFTASINPDFINAAQPVDSKSFWKSQQFPNEFRGMDIGDVNGDGLNETVFVDPHTIFIYQKKEGSFKLIQQITGKSYDNYIGVDVADINGNGIKEIIVTNYVGGVVSSFVVEYRNDKFATIASGLRWFMRVIDNGSGVPILIGQRRGVEKPFDTPIHEIRWQDGGYVEGRKMQIPEGLSVYGLTLGTLGSGGGEKIIALNEDDYLNIYEKTDKPLSLVSIFGGSKELFWKSDDVFGGSNIFIDPLIENSLKLSETDATISYINHRILSYDTNQDGKREFIIVKNISASARAFQRIKLFNSAEIYNLEWDGMGMVENWRTKRISGYVADYQFKDIDNNGENEVVLALVLTSGGATKGRSVIISYSLAGQ